MIRYYNLDQKEIREHDSAVDRCWIHLEPPFETEELRAFADEHLIPLDFITDSLDIDERSRYEIEDDVKLILINTPILNEVTKENEAIYITVPLGIILTPDHIITVSSRQNPIIKLFLDRKVKNFNPQDHQLFVLQLLQQAVLRFLLCLKKLNLKRNVIESELYDSSRNAELKELLRIEKSLVYFVNSLSSNELLKMKMKRIDLLKIKSDEQRDDLFEDIIIDNGQALEMANVYTNILGGTLEAYASIVSNNLNKVMERLTLVSIILMVPTLIASFMGMNVKLPFSENSSWSFFGLLIISLLFSLLMVLFFRRRKMF